MLPKQLRILDYLVSTLHSLRYTKNPWHAAGTLSKFSRMKRYELTRNIQVFC